MAATGALAPPALAASPSVGCVTERAPRELVGIEPDGTPVSLEARMYSPAAIEGAGGQPAPAVLLAHGFSGTAASLAAQARARAQSGYVVLAWKWPDEVSAASCRL